MTFDIKIQKNIYMLDLLLIKFRVFQNNFRTEFDDILNKNSVSSNTTIMLYDLR